MKIEYILEESDFIDYYLFSYSENKGALKTIKISKFLLFGLFIYFAIDLYNSNLVGLAIVFGVLAIAILVFYNKICQSKLKRHFTKVVKKNYQNRLGEKETMEFTSDYIITEDKTNEGKTKISDIEKINETQNNFFIKLSNGSSFIISKKEIDNLDNIKLRWKALNIPISDHLEWEWKL